jgi:hypothetical protein
MTHAKQENKQITTHGAKMRRVLVLVVASAFVASGAYGKSCKHCEYAELKAMTKIELGTNYCLAVLDKRIVEADGNYANSMERLNAPRGSPGHSDLSNNHTDALRASDAADQCDNEIDRMSRILAAKGTNIMKLRKECKLDE